MTRVAVIGLGAMGSRVARRLADAGNEVIVWNRTRAKAEELGLPVADTPAEAARGAEVVITMVANPEALRAVTEGDNGVAAGIGDTALIEMSTVGPAAVARLAQRVPTMLDAPVLGSVSEAETGTLKIFAGGAAELVERWSPLLSMLGDVIPVGGSGAGAAAKLVANSTLFGTIAVVGEAVALADALGLSRDAAFAVLGVSPVAAQAERRRPAIEAGEYPPRFALRLARKDADLIADAVDADLRVAEAARSWLVDADDAGDGDEDYSVVVPRILGER
ncbi:MAG: NAD(P)-dependent oxidoreductase [Actinobacteria bacterium]|nr:MAG: NAD(P)-dependent oxidoreductase [Actinomycetota bacterium]